MKAAIAAKWARALKSGKFKQTKGALCDQNGHCCLGVLVELYHKEYDTTWNQKSHLMEGDQRAKGFKGCVLTLPGVVMEWAGIRDEEGSFFEDGTRASSSLARMNDMEGKTFPELADVILDWFEDL
jgi:hypothetical protein